MGRGCREFSTDVSKESAGWFPVQGGVGRAGHRPQQVVWAVFCQNAVEYT